MSGAAQRHIVGAPEGRQGAGRNLACLPPLGLVGVGEEGSTRRGGRPGWLGRDNLTGWGETTRLTGGDDLTGWGETT